MNVFDYIDDFYKQDPSWGEVLPRKHVEGFIRERLWQDAEDAEVVVVWEHLTMLCVYAGNLELNVYSLSREDIIDCVGWCGRNIADFHLTTENVEALLDTLEGFYKYLKRVKAVRRANPVPEAKEKLIVAGRLQIFDAEGNVTGKHAQHNMYSSYDLPAKVYMNVGEKIGDILKEVYDYFGEPEFNKDWERVNFVYGGLSLGMGVAPDHGSQEYIDCLWDYFLMDYRLLNKDVSPLEEFKRAVLAGEVKKQVSLDVIDELINAKLVMFKIKGFVESDMYECVDILSKEHYVLTLPMDPEEASGLDEVVFMAHIFYNESMVMSFVRGMRYTGKRLEKLLQVLHNARTFYSLRLGQKPSWQEFISRNPMFVRHIWVNIASLANIDNEFFPKPKLFYRPGQVQSDGVSHCIAGFMGRNGFGSEDIRLVQTMWSDFCNITNKKIHSPEAWAAGVIRCFMDLNQVYNYDLKNISEFCDGVSPANISRTSREIWETLDLQYFDVRYVNEDGMILMLFYRSVEE